MSETFQFSSRLEAAIEHLRQQVEELDAKIMAGLAEVNRLLAERAPLIHGLVVLGADLRVPSRASVEDDRPAPVENVAAETIDREAMAARDRGASSAATTTVEEPAASPPPPPAPRRTPGLRSVKASAMSVVCECGAEFAADRVAYLNDHCLGVHGRRSTVAERTPVVGSGSGAA